MSAYAGPDTQPSSIHNPFGILGAVRMGLGTVLAVLALLFLRPHIGSVGDMLSGESGSRRWVSPWL